MKVRMIGYVAGLLIAIPLITGCDDEENAPRTGAVERRYTLSPLNNSGVSGTAVFTKVDDATTKVVLELTGTSAGSSHPAHLHGNDAASGGPIVLDFTPVDGASGKSETMVTALNDGTPVTYEELIGFDGHVNVHKSATELSVMLAQGNVGSNVAAPAPPADPGDGNGGY